MMLSDGDLIAALSAHELDIDPFLRRQIQPASIDLRLDSRFELFSSGGPAVMDPLAEQVGHTFSYEVPDGQHFPLEAGQFVLGCTLERVMVGPCLAAKFEGKSSLGRLGLVVHSTAGFIDPGFDGQITLELSNVNSNGKPILLTPGMSIGQICVFRLSSPAQVPYGSPGLGSRYQGQDGPTPSRAATPQEKS